jgi:hypothetical protein
MLERFSSRRKRGKTEKQVCPAAANPVDVIEIYRIFSFGPARPERCAIWRAFGLNGSSGRKAL